MLNLMPALNTASLKLGIALMNLPRNIPRYIIHDDGTYEVIERVEEGIQTYSANSSGYVASPTRFQYTVPWNMDIVYEGIDMMLDMLKNAVPVALWIFLLISGIHLVINIVRALGQ